MQHLTTTLMVNASVAQSFSFKSIIQCPNDLDTLRNSCKLHHAADHNAFTMPCKESLDSTHDAVMSIS